MKKLWIGIIILAIVALFTVILFTQTDRGANEIKIGSIIPLTGNFAVYGEPVRDGMLLALEEINNAGGINGKKVNVVIEDDAGDPKTSVNAFTKLATVDRVPIILGPLSSGSSMATAPVAERNRVVQISTLAGIPALSEAGDYVFRIYPSSEVGASFAAQEAVKRFNPEKIAIMYMHNPFGEAAKSIYEEAARRFEIKIVDMESFPDGETDFRTQLSKIKQAEPDILFCSAYWGEGSRILVQMQELGIDIPVVGEDGWRGPIADIVGEEGLKRLYFADIAFGKEFKNNETMQEFIKNFEKEYRENATTYAATGYDAMYIAKKAIEESGYDGQKIRDVLYKINYEGALGNIKFNEKGDDIGVKFAFFRLNGKNEGVLVK